MDMLPHFSRYLEGLAIALQHIFEYLSIIPYAHPLEGALVVAQILIVAPGVV